MWEISVERDSNVDSLLAEFTKAFPYLKLIIIDYKGNPVSGKIGAKKHLNAQVENESICITGNKYLVTIKREFQVAFRLHIEFQYLSKSGKVETCTNYELKKSLFDMNKEKEALGCIKWD